MIMFIVYDPCVVNDEQQHMRPNPFVRTEVGVEMMICKITLMDIGNSHSNEFWTQIFGCHANSSANGIAQQSIGHYDYISS